MRNVLRQNLDALRILLQALVLVMLRPLKQLLLPMVLSFRPVGERIRLSVDSDVHFHSISLQLLNPIDQLGLPREKLLGNGSDAFG